MDDRSTRNLEHAPVFYDLLGAPPDDEPMVQASWDRVTGGLGLARSDAWTGEPLRPLTRLGRLWQWGTSNMLFAQIGNITMAVVCGGAIWTTATATTRTIETQWRRRGELKLIVDAGDDGAFRVHPTPLGIAPAIIVPPPGGPGGSQLFKLPDGTRLFVAPGAEFAGKPADQFTGIVSEFRNGELRIERATKGALVIFTPIAAANFGPGTIAVMRATKTEVVVTVFAGQANLMPGRTSDSHNIDIFAGESGRMRAGATWAEFVTAIHR